MFPLAHRSFSPIVQREQGKYFCRACSNTHVFSKGNIKQFDMVLLFSFGTLDMFALLFSFFSPFLSFSTWTSSGERKQSPSWEGGTVCAGVTLGILPLSLPSPSLDKQQVKRIYKIAEIISLILSAQMESKAVSNLSPESAGVGLTVFKYGKSSSLTNLASCTVCCVS